MSFIILSSMFKKIILKNYINNRIFVRYVESATFPIKEYQTHKLDTTLPDKASVTKEEGLKYYKQMATIRRMENTAGALYREKLIRGFCHLYCGQEAICVGVKANLEKGDGVITAYRAHGWCLIMGMTIEGVMGELMGVEIGCARGKGGSMHMYTPDFYGGNGIVGAQIPLGVGIGFANKYKENGKVSIALYGDGAANQGQIFEVYNMSKLWNLPVIFICENNLYGMGTSVDRASANTKFYTRGDVIPGIQIDGMDVLAVREAFKFARSFVLKEGPIVLEMVTYRYYGHSMSDPGTSYRSRDEISEVRQTRDPITSFRDKLIAAKVATDADIKEIEDKTKKELDAVLEICKKAKEIGLKELTADIYAKNLHPSIRNNLPWNSLTHSQIGKPVNL